MRRKPTSFETSPEREAIRQRAAEQAQRQVEYQDWADKLRAQGVLTRQEWKDIVGEFYGV